MLSLVLALLIAGSTLLFENAGKINQYLNVPTSMAVQREGSEVGDTTYYAAAALNTFGTDVTSKANALKVEMTAAAESVRQAEEGTVVLWNPNGFLPWRRTGATR